MNIKKLIIVIPLIMIFLLSGCGGYDKIVADKPLSEDEVIAYVKEQIYEETGDTVKVEIVSKKKLRVATAWLDGPMGYQDVVNGHEYKFKIINEKTGFEATATYKDAFIIYDKEDYPGGSKEEAAFYNNYTERRGYNAVKTGFIDALDERFDKYYIYDDVSTDEGLDVFICSTDFEKIDGLLNEFKEITIAYEEQQYVTYSVYIYKDEKVFNSTDFEKYKTGHEDYSGQSFGKDMIKNYTGKEATFCSFCHSFDRAFFESNGVINAKPNKDNVSPDSFDYIVFWYNAEPNSFVNSGPSVYVYGVK